MAYQARIAIDRIKFAIRHTEQFSKPCIHVREAGLQLLVLKQISTSSKTTVAQASRSLGISLTAMKQSAGG